MADAPLTQHSTHPILFTFVFHCSCALLLLFFLLFFVSHLTCVGRTTRRERERKGEMHPSRGKYLSSLEKERRKQEESEKRGSLQRNSRDEGKSKEDAFDWGEARVRFISCVSQGKTQSNLLSSHFCSLCSPLCACALVKTIIEPPTSSQHTWEHEHGKVEWPVVRKKRVKLMHCTRYSSLTRFSQHENLCTIVLCRSCCLHTPVCERAANEEKNTKSPV